MERNQNPDSIHCTILPHHIPVVDKFLKDIEEATVECKVSDLEQDKTNKIMRTSKTQISLGIRPV